MAERDPLISDRVSAKDAAPLRIVVANPRGFCAGVDRAIQIVEVAIQKYGAPVYVRHEIVHNKFVVDSLREKGAVFVEELAEVPDNVPVIFSAHGVPKSVPAEAERRELTYVDATCPLVSKVHRQAERLIKQDKHILFVGHDGHPEVIGTFGQVPDGRMTLIETVADVADVAVENEGNLAFLTQTTLSVDDTAEIIAALKVRFPDIQAPRGEDICYATSNRQEAVKALAEEVDVVLVIGATNSSNSLRLVEVAERNGARGYLVERARALTNDMIAGAETIGITAGASAPEVLVQEVIAALSAGRDVTVSTLTTAEEDVTFKLPRVLSQTA
ncbi:MAG: 4-hydroxy-3-methylbut-2-enyl diphosphate reductase [Pacificimonas sp.]|jgi:4-hydroxy-3-methylbut-2-enyl diphosphate reductase|nr:4-hydroxy-3-methylbut-2-enyl diphosphate reductase [Pacificimonas sp.]